VAASMLYAGKSEEPITRQRGTTARKAASRCLKKQLEDAAGFK